jgi:hypothetical protein
MSARVKNTGKVLQALFFKVECCEVSVSRKFLLPENTHRINDRLFSALTASWMRAGVEEHITR